MQDVEKIRSLFTASRPFFTALCDPVRQDLMLDMMCGEWLSVKELTSRSKLSRPAISHHLKVLKDAHIIIEHKEGRQTFYRPQPGEYFYVVKELIDTIDTVINKEDTPR